MQTKLVALAKRIGWATVGIWDPLWILGYRIRHRDFRPIPPFKNRNRIGASEIGWFLEGGRADADVVRRVVETHSKTPLAEQAMLDFGAGCGRILQHFANDIPSAKLFATDVDPTAIQFLQLAYPAITSLVNQSQPPLALPANTLDIAYSFSVWTHLPIESQLPWLLEMKRVLKPNGLLIVSFLGFNALKTLRENTNPHEDMWNEVSDEMLREAGILYKEYPIFAEGDELFSGITGSYGLTVHDPAYLRAEWGKHFGVVSSEPQAFHGHHDLIVLRNR